MKRLIDKYSKQAQKEYKTSHDWIKKVDPLRIVQEIKISS